MKQEMDIKNVYSTNNDYLIITNNNNEVILYKTSNGEYSIPTYYTDIRGLLISDLIIGQEFIEIKRVVGYGKCYIYKMKDPNMPDGYKAFDPIAACYNPNVKGYSKKIIERLFLFFCMIIKCPLFRI